MYRKRPGLRGTIAVVAGALAMLAGSGNGITVNGGTFRLVRT